MIKIVTTIITYMVLAAITGDFTNLTHLVMAGVVLASPAVFLQGVFKRFDEWKRTRDQVKQQQPLKTHMSRDPFSTGPVNCRCAVIRKPKS